MTRSAFTTGRGDTRTRVIAVKGSATLRQLVGLPTKVEVTVRGRRIQGGAKVWPVGVDIAKTELYGWLRLRRSPDGTVPKGFCHFPEYGEDYFQQLTAEELVTVVDRKTRKAKRFWRVIANRENHFLDCRVYARVAAAVLGIDRKKGKKKAKQQAAAVASPAATSSPTTPDAPSSPAGKKSKRPRDDRGRSPSPFSRGRDLFSRRR
jgi:phage terminase large subunit GpA-like protein